MRFSCSKSLLEKVTQAVINFTDSTSSIGLLLADMHSGQLRLRVTSSESECEVNITAEISEEGEILIDLRRLGAYLSSLGAEYIRVISKESKIELISPGSNISFAGLSETKEYVPFPPEGRSSISVKCGTLNTAINAVLSIADSSHSPVKGIELQVEAHKKRGIVASTDTRRISEYHFEVENPKMKGGNTIIIPKAIAGKMLSFLSKLVPGNLAIALAWGDALFKVSGEYLVGKDMGEFTIKSRTLDFFPAYRNALVGYENGNPDIYKVTLEREAMIQAINRISCLLDQKNKTAIPFATFAYNNGEILIRFAAEIGESLEIIGNVEGNKDFYFHANPIYLLDGLKQIHTKKFEMLSINQLKPIKLLPFESLTGFQYFFFPVRQGS